MHTLPTTFREGLPTRPSPAGLPKESITMGVPAAQLRKPPAGQTHFRLHRVVPDETLAVRVPAAAVTPVMATIDYIKLQTTHTWFRCCVKYFLTCREQLSLYDISVAPPANHSLLFTSAAMLTQKCTVLQVVP